MLPGSGAAALRRGSRRVRAGAAAEAPGFTQRVDGGVSAAAARLAGRALAAARGSKAHPVYKGPVWNLAGGNHQQTIPVSSPWKVARLDTSEREAANWGKRGAWQCGSVNVSISAVGIRLQTWESSRRDEIPARMLVRAGGKPRNETGLLCSATAALSCEGRQMSGPLWASRRRGGTGDPQHPAELGGDVSHCPGPVWVAVGLAKSLPAQGRASALPLGLSRSAQWECTFPYLRF